MNNHYYNQRLAYLIKELLKRAVFEKGGHRVEGSRGVAVRLLNIHLSEWFGLEAMFKKRLLQALSDTLTNDGKS